jgi:hypothetical protein
VLDRSIDPRDLPVGSSFGDAATLVARRTAAAAGYLIGRPSAVTGAVLGEPAEARGAWAIWRGRP